MGSPKMFYQVGLYLLGLVPILSVSGHGNMVWPPIWQDEGGRIGLSPGMSCYPGAELIFDGDKEKIGAACFWYNNYTHIEGEPTIASHMRTFANIEPWAESFVARNPWMAPGSAQIFTPCGAAGGNPLGCPVGGPMKPGRQCDDYGGGFGYGPHAEDYDFKEVIITEWKRGETAMVGWGMVANHGGGYSYRLCKVPEAGASEITEECFQKTPLKFASNEQWIQVGDDESTKQTFIANRTTEGTIPTGSEWTKNPVPNCAGIGGGFFNKDPTKCEQGYQFPPHLAGLFGQGANVDADPRATFQWTLMDELNVPEDLEPGDYVLSFRWDTEQTPQVWSTCSSLKIV